MLLLLFVVSLPAFGATLEGRWQGSIRLAENGVSEAWVEVRFVPEGDGWKGIISVPSIIGRNQPIHDLSFDGQRLSIVLDVPGNPMFNGTVTSTKIEGDFRQDGKSWPFRLTRK
jgi:hypothetical protein